MEINGVCCEPIVETQVLTSGREIKWWMGDCRKPAGHDGPHSRWVPIRRSTTDEPTGGEDG